MFSGGTLPGGDRKNRAQLGKAADRQPGGCLAVLGAMGLRDVRRLRGEAGRAIFREDIEKETFAQIFGEKAKSRTHAVQPIAEGETAFVPDP
jgi:hypothetical protein